MEGPFKLREHLERLYRSLHYARMKLDMGLSEMERATLEVVEANAPFLKEDGGHRIEHIVTSGVAPKPRNVEQPTVIIYCAPIPFILYARLYKTGLNLITPAKHVPPQSLDPRLKTTSRILNRIAHIEVQQLDRNANPLLLDLARAS